MYEPRCYWCDGASELSIKARRKNVTTMICKSCRNAQMSDFKERTYYMPAKKTKEIGWSEAWLKKAKESQDRISSRGVNYGI